VDDGFLERLDRSFIAQRQRDGLPIYGLPVSFTGQRWLSSYGTDSFELSHAESGPDTFPLIKVGLIGTTRVDNYGGYYDMYSTLSSDLLLSERSRNDPAFQYETRDQEVIDRMLSSVPGREVWESTTIEIDGRPEEFLRQDRGSDWIAFRELGGECVWVHVEESDGTPVSIVTLSDITAYLRATV
jgi:hypothetical protein